MTVGTAAPEHVVCILMGGPDYTLDGIRFEWHPRCGPVVLDNDGDPKNTQPGARHPFWLAVGWWREQGMRVTESGECIYDVPPEPRVVHLVGRHYVEVPEGKEPEDVRREWFARLKLPLPEVTA